MSIRKTYNWKCRSRTLELGQRTLVMGILNVTPDSFSDGGNFINADAAVERALEMVAQGADIIDVGGESTRPGAEPVPVDEEIRRTIPVIEEILANCNVPVSIDTTKAEVALQALQAGADIVNDVSALEADPGMAEIVACTGAGMILMHKKGTPQDMQDSPVYVNVVHEVIDYLDKRLRFSEQCGIQRDRLVVDPGFGFGKTLVHNLALMRALDQLAEIGSPLLVGVSRKSFIGSLTGRKTPDARRAGSLGAAAWSVLRGTHILRVHDVIDTCDVCRILDSFLTGDS